MKTDRENLLEQKLLEAEAGWKEEMNGNRELLSIITDLERQISTLKTSAYTSPACSDKRGQMDTLEPRLGRALSATPPHPSNNAIKMDRVNMTNNANSDHPGGY